MMNHMVEGGYLPFNVHVDMEICYSCSVINKCGNIGLNDESSVFGLVNCYYFISFIIHNLLNVNILPCNIVYVLVFTYRFYNCQCIILFNVMLDSFLQATVFINICT